MEAAFCIVVAWKRIMVGGASCRLEKTTTLGWNKSLLFLVVSFQDSLALEDPVEVLKVGLSISACRAIARL